jgi:hypothetical protein
VTDGGEEIEQLMLEARMLNIVGDWRGLDVVLTDLNPLLHEAGPMVGRDFYRELVRYNDLRDRLVLMRMEYLS